MLAYTIKSVIFLSMMYIPYMLMLRKESFFHFNRILLVCIMLLSLILPLCDFHALSIENNPIQHGMIVIGTPTAVVESANNITTIEEINWFAVAFYVYIIGMAATFIWKMVQLAVLYGTIRNGVLWKDEQYGTTIYCHAQDIAPFSWLNTIVISEDDYNNNATEILRHEMGHIEHHHSYDIILVNIVQTIQWWYNSTNSPIEAYNGKSMNYQLLTGVKYDHKGNLWLLNSQAPSTSMLKYTDGTFTKLNQPELMKLNYNSDHYSSNGEMRNIIIDSQGVMWFVNNNWYTPALYQYDMNNDNIIAYENIVNQDGTKLVIKEGIRCIVEDLEHNMWVGTSVGPVVLERKEIENNGNTFTQVKVPRNDGTNYADYLLANIDVSSIAVDKGNRKWIGTANNGVYLISADNLEQIQHFTVENCPLLSNTVKSITINSTTGEVFFGTENGLCSYVSDATETNTEMTTENVWAYPNPVEPNYTGPITITGLSLNADIKILTTNGTIVNEGRSNGGTYVWDGCDQKGRRVASGIYMVAAATNKGEKGTVCKIAIIN